MRCGGAAVVSGLFNDVYGAVLCWEWLCRGGSCVNEEAMTWWMGIVVAEESVADIRGYGRRESSGDEDVASALLDRMKIFIDMHLFIFRLVGDRAVHVKSPL